MLDKSPYFQRAPRVKRTLPTKDITIHRPPAEPQKPSMSMEQLIIPLISTALSVGLFYYISQKMETASSSTYLLFMMASSVPMVFSFLYSMFSYGRLKYQYKKEMKQRETTYLGHLQNHTEELKDLQQQQMKVLSATNPSPDECVRRIRERRSSLWERSPESDDFLNLRIGQGEQPFRVNINVPIEDGYEIDPLISKAQEVSFNHQSIGPSPIQLPLFESKVVGIVGSKQDIMNMVRLITLQLVTHHSPDEVKIASFYPEEDEKEWDWMRWLPHTWDEGKESRFLAKDQQNATKMFEQLFSKLNIRKIYRDAEGKQQQNLPIWTFFLSAAHFVEEDPLVPLLLKEADTVGACTFLFADRKEALPMQCQLIIEASGNQGTLIQTLSTGKESFDRQEVSFQPDVFSLKEAEKMARMMAPIRLKQSSAEAIPKVVTLLDLFNINRMEELNLKERWAQNRYPTSFPVPIGFRAGGKEVILNIHDKIEKNGHGPHGLMAGTTGSGKSEVIQTIIASLAVNYHPHEMAFMLIDYKGGGMSNTFSGLPHVIATITNLEDENIIERAKTSLKAELVRRQQIFNHAGNLQHIDEYYQSPERIQNPLPHLFIVIDEFAQLKKEQPEFMDELISIAAVGRTLGVHLLLATQKPAGVVDDKIWSNSRFRICLRVQDDADSRDMLKIPNAARINIPGRGYLQVGSDEVLELFQSAWSGAPYMEKGQEEIKIAEVALSGERTKKAGVAKATNSTRKQLDVLNEYIQQAAIEQGITSLQGPWQDPLPEELYLADLQENKKEETNDNWLRPVVGKIDDVENQEQYSFRVNLNEGHMAIYGMPGTGKTTFLQTLTLSLTSTHSPEDLHLYMLDFGKMLRDFAKLPHVGDVIQEEEHEKVKRFFIMLCKELTRRKDLFSKLGTKTLATYRQSGYEKLPAIVVLLDGYATFRKSFEEQEEQLEMILREGANLGIYFVITANKVTDFYEKIRSNIPSGVAYELADSSDYHSIVGRLNKAPSRLPAGRAFAKGSVPPLQFQTALATEGESEVERTKLLREKIQQLRNTWTGMEAPAVPMLQSEISLPHLIGSTDHSAGFPVGLQIESLEPYHLRIEDNPTTLVSGRIEGGITSALKTIFLSMSSTLSPEELHLYLIDADPTRDGIMAYRNLSHVKDIGYHAENVERILQGISDELDRRVTNLSFLEEEQADLSTEITVPKLVIIIDKIDKLLALASFDNEIENLLLKIINHNKGKDCYLIIGGQADYLSSSYDAGVADIRKVGCGFLLGTTNSTDLQLFNIRVPYQEADQELPAGEGYFYKRKSQKVKIAYPYSDGYTPEKWVKQLNYNVSPQR